MTTEIALSPSRLAGMDRIEAVLPRIGQQYEKQRNFDFGPAQRQNVSQLSAYLRRRLILEEEVLTPVLRQHGLPAAEKFVQEVFWRGYFKGWLEHRPAVWGSYRDSVGRLVDELDADSALRDRYDTAVGAATGIQCFDAWSAELVETGYLHNHARMWFASIWVFTLRLPWQLGADFFYRHLIDGDPASNTLSWRWVCGLHTRGKHYLARADNIARFTDGRFNPVGQLNENAAPLQEDRDWPIGELPAFPELTDTGKVGLLITEEDCHPVSLGLSVRPSALFAVGEAQERSPLSLGNRARHFSRGAVDDAVARAEQEFDCEATAATEKNWSRQLTEWACTNDLTRVVTAYAPVGAVADRLTTAREALRAEGVELSFVQREYDAFCWPHAAKGFFRLKKKIPEILKRLRISGVVESDKR